MCYTCTYAVAHEDPDDPDPARSRGRAPEAQGTRQARGHVPVRLPPPRVTLLSTQLSWEELFEEIDRDGPALTGDVDTVEEIRRGREERDRELDARTPLDVPPE